jgi:hypothetical protein
MAAVTLKDLMDPLTKIQAATESSAESLDALTLSVATGNGQRNVQTSILRKIQTSLANRLGKLIEATVEADSLSIGEVALARELRVQTKLLKLISKGPGKADDGGAEGKAKGAVGKSSKGFKDGAEALKLLGAGASTLAKGLIIFKFVPKKAITKFKDSLYDLYGVMQDFDTKKIKEGAEAFALMANSIGKFAVGLVKAAILLPIGILGIKLLGIVIKMAIPIFANLGKKSKDVNKGAKALDLMGTSMLSFAKGLALAGLVSVVGLVAVPFLILSIGLLGGAFFLLGKMSTGINKGSRTLDKMGDAMKSFAIGLGIFAIVSVLSVVALPFMVASLLLIGGAVFLLGKMSKQIRKGTATLSLMGLGIALFGFGYAIFASTFPENVGLMDVIIQAAAIGLIGGAVGLIGKFKLKDMASGVLSLVMMGAGLVIFGFGYERYAEATRGIGLMDVLVQAAAIVGIGLAAAIVGKFGISNVAMGALALALNGAGLLIFSLGYTPFAESTKGMTLGDVGIQAAALTAIGVVMGVAGLAVAASAGTVMLGPALFAAAGGALLLLAPGLKAMRDLKYTEGDAKELAVTLGAVTMAFSGVKEDDSFFGAIGSAFAQVGKSGAGLAAAALYAAAGGSLIVLSKGLTAFKNVGFTEDDSKMLAVTLGAISTGFAQAGGEAKNPGGLLGSVFGNALSPNAVEIGIKSVLRSGDALRSIANGLTSFKGIEDPIGISAKISQVVGFVSKAFAAIADEGNVEAGGFFGSLFGVKKNKVAEGIESVKGVGKELKDIADGLAVFKGIENPEVLGSKISAVVGMVGSAFAAVGGKTNEKSALFGLVSWDEDAIQAGIQSVSGAGKTLEEIATGLQAFSGNFEPVAVAESIGKMLTSVGEAFSSLYAANPEMSAELKDFSTFIVTLGDVAEKGLLDKAADGIAKIADSINKIDIEKTVAFGDLFRSSADLSRNDNAYEALADAVSEIRDMLASSGSGGGGALPASTGTGSPVATASSSGSNGKVLAKLNRTLSSLNNAITQLPGNIESAEFIVKLDGT